MTIKDQQTVTNDVGLKNRVSRNFHALEITCRTHYTKQDGKIVVVARYSE